MTAETAVAVAAGAAAAAVTAWWRAAAAARRTARHITAARCVRCGAPYDNPLRRDA